MGDRLLSGRVDVNGAFEMKADRLSSESQYAKIVTLVKKAQEEKAHIQRLADRYAVLFTPLTLLMALIGYLITKDSTTILSVLVVATPCPLHSGYARCDHLRDQPGGRRGDHRERGRAD